jgi:hypothetical protein
MPLCFIEPMIGHLPEHATAFAALFARVEHTLPDKDLAVTEATYL